MSKKKDKDFLDKYYTGKEAELYDYKRERKDIRRFAEVKKQIENTRELLKNLPETNILDVACGTGRYFKLYGKRKIYGIDISKDMLELAKKADKKAILKVSDADNIPYPDKTFDVVITSQFIQHAPYYLNVLKEMKRVCKKNGYIIVDFPNKYSLSYAFRKVKGFLGFAKRSYNFFTMREIEKLAEKLNLEIVEVRKTIIITPVLFPKSMVKISSKLNNFLITLFPGLTYKNYVLLKSK